MSHAKDSVTDAEERVTDFGAAVVAVLENVEGFAGDRLAQVLLASLVVQIGVAADIAEVAKPSDVGLYCAAQTNFDNTGFTVG